MAKELLSETKINRARLPADKNEMSLSDGDGLYLRMRRSRSDESKAVRQWLFVYKVGSSARKIGLGSYESVSLTAARLKADEQRKRRDAGAMPTHDSASGDIRTVGDLFARLQQVRTEGTEYRAQLWERHIEGRLGSIKLEDLKRAQIAALLDDLRVAGRRKTSRGIEQDMKRTAGAVFGLLKLITAFGVSRDLLSADPMFGMKRKDFGHQGLMRQRKLAPPELTELSQRFAQVLRVGPKGREFDVPALHPGAQAACWFLVATCARVGELSAMRLRDIDFDANTWTIPAEVAKNGRPHIVHLSPFALRMIDAMRRLPTKPRAGSEKPADTIYWGGDTLAKALHDRQHSPDGEQDRSGKRAVSSALLLPAGPFTPHDLRRTGATLMGELGVLPHIVEKCLNHTMPKLMQTYQLAEMLDERRDAFTRLGARLEELIQTTGIDRALSIAEGC